MYSEQNPQDAPFPVTHYPAPGLVELIDYTASYGNRVRGIYVSSNDYVFVVVDQSLINYSLNVLCGTLPTNSGVPVSMCDNGTTLVVVDGTTWGGTVPLASPGSGSLTTITDTNFYGSTRVDFIDTFLVFNMPNTQNFYTTTSNVVTPFDPLYFASKAGWNDILICACCLHDNIWLLGAATTEIWYNAGAAAFPFARMPNSILQQGCVAPYSVVVADNAVYWLSQDRFGRNMMMRGEGYGAKRVSTFAIEDIWSKYATIADAVGMVYQIGGHESIGLYFPIAQAWWVYDASAQMWHQRTFDGIYEPWLPYCMGYGRPALPGTPGGAVYAGDRNSGRIYEVSRNAYTDAGTQIVRQRSWTHVQGDDGQRVHHSRFAASFFQNGLPDVLQLDWSDDAGMTYGAQVGQTTDNATNGQYQWRRLGYARDRVYRLTWNANGESALNGAYLDVVPHGT